MAICRVCGAESPPEKAWCPHCNQPLEPEEKRPVAREIETFAGTLAGKPKPVLEPEVSLAPPVVKVPAAPPALEVKAVFPLESEAQPEPQTVSVQASASRSPRPTASTKASEAKEWGIWVYLLIGALLGFILLVALAGGIALWFYLQ